MSNEALTDLRALVNEQAEEEGLWFIADTVIEAFFQQELRKLHAAVERALASLPEGAPNPDSDHPAGLIQATSSAGSSKPLGMKFRKRPAVIEASQWFKNGDHPLDKSGGWEGRVVRYYRHPDVPGDRPCEQCGKPYHVHGWVDTLEQGHRVCPGDWIITGVKGERYPCKPDIFAATYEPVEVHAKQEGQPMPDGGENGEAGSTKGSKGAAIDEATKP